MVFEAVVCLASGIRVKDYYDRRHVDFVRDRTDLLALRVTLGVYGQGETRATVEGQIAELDREVEKWKANGIRGAGNLAHRADNCGMGALYVRYYKMLSLDVHCGNDTLGPYVVHSPGVAVTFAQRPGGETERLWVSETLSNLVILVAAALNEHYALGLQQKAGTPLGTFADVVASFGKEGDTRPPAQA